HRARTEPSRTHHGEHTDPLRQLTAPLDNIPGQTDRTDTGTPRRRDRHESGLHPQPTEHERNPPAPTTANTPTRYAS
ncbi:hypothetical protein, partial [Streptomyces sp. NPDC002276]